MTAWKFMFVAIVLCTTTTFAQEDTVKVGEMSGTDITFTFDEQDIIDAVEYDLNDGTQIYLVYPAYVSSTKARVIAEGDTILVAYECFIDGSGDVYCTAVAIKNTCKGDPYNCCKFLEDDSGTIYGCTCDLLKDIRCQGSWCDHGQEDNSAGFIEYLSAL